MFLPLPYRTLPACLLALAGCAQPDPDPRNTVVLHYQHVANVRRIEFSAPVPVPQRSEPVQFVQALDSQGFWAVFVLCRLDASGAGIPSLYFDVDRLRVRYAGRRYGPPPPYALRLDDSAEVNTPRDTPILSAAIDEALRTGDYSRVFRHGDHAGLDVRFAIFVPHALPDYAGGRLALHYEGGRVLAVPNDYRPSRVDSAGPGGTAVGAHCLP